jgi:glycosyltransferase involved in cell wall biosynthesis
LIHILELRSAVGTGGGPEKTILLGTAQSDPSRFRVTVCYLRNQSDTAFDVSQRGNHLGIKIVDIPERSSLDVSAYRQIQQLCREQQVDIVHGHDYKTDLYAVLLARSTGIIPMATAHGWTGHSWKERYVYYPADKRVLAHMTYVVAVSGDIRSELLRAGAAPERVEVILNGIDPAAFMRDPSRVTAARAAFGLAADDIAIGSIGRLEPQKRYDLLIAAASELRGRWPTLRVLIAGEGTARQSLERQIVERNLEGACVLLGHQPDIVLLHHALDLYVQASDYEGTPNAVLEAMAMRTPVVATDAGGTSELIAMNQDGIVVPIGDVDRLTGAIDSMLRDRGAASRLATSARHRVETELSFARRMERVAGVYERLIVSRGQ